MKYLQDDGLSRMTALLTDCPVSGGGVRSIHGKLEAYTMKRAGTDKKYATQLGSSWIANQERVEANATVRASKTKIQSKRQSDEKQNQLSISTEGEVTNLRNIHQKQRNRSVSLGYVEDLKRNTPDNLNKNKRKIQNMISFHKAQRRRSNSLGTLEFSSRLSSNSYEGAENYRPLQPPTIALGDLSESSTRRLLTDLILTLNMSFPDYDFGSSKPSDYYRFTSVSIPIQQINNKLSDLAMSPRFLGDYGSVQPGDGGLFFLKQLWKAIDDVIGLSSCEVFSYQPRPASSKLCSSKYSQESIITSGVSEGRSSACSDDDPMAFLEQTLLSSSAQQSLSSSPSTTSIPNPRSFSHNVGPSSCSISNSIGTIPALNANVGFQDIRSGDCSTYRDSYSRNNEEGLLETVLWSFNYFFVNKTTKRILLFTCIESMRCQTAAPIQDDDDDEPEHLFCTKNNNHYRHPSERTDFDRKLEITEVNALSCAPFSADRNSTSSCPTVCQPTLIKRYEPVGQSIQGKNCEGQLVVSLGSTGEYEIDYEEEIIEDRKYDEDDDDDDDDDSSSNNLINDDSSMGMIKQRRVHSNHYGSVLDRNYYSSHNNSNKNEYDDDSSVAGSEDFDMDPESMVSGGIPILHM